MVSRRTKWVAGAALLGVAGVAAASSVDQGSLARTLLPMRRPKRGLTGWQGDLDFLKDAVAWHELGATRAQRDDFEDRLALMRPKSLNELNLACCEALAAFENAATTVIGTRARRLPVRFGWMYDSLVVVKADPEHEHLAGQRVRLIAGGEPAVTWPLFSRYVGGGTPAWLRNRSAWFFTVPEALAQVGLGVHDGQVSMELEALDGTISHTVLGAGPTPMPGGPTADFRDRFPGDEGLGTRGWRTALLDPDEDPDSGDRPSPLYLQHWDQLLLTRELPMADRAPALYLRLMSTPEGDDPTPEAIEDAIGLVEAGQYSRYVVDVRYHNGGDYRVTLPLVKQVARVARERHAPIKVLVGPNTMGGGLIGASQYLAHAPERTTIIGNDVGDRLRSRAQGRSVRLPRSGLVVQLCHDWHDLSTDAHPWSDVWLPDKFLLQGIGDFRPDLDVQNSWRDYLAGHDRLVETALV